MFVCVWKKRGLLLSAPFTMKSFDLFSKVTVPIYNTVLYTAGLTCTWKIIIRPGSISRRSWNCATDNVNYCKVGGEKNENKIRNNAPFVPPHTLWTLRRRCVTRLPSSLSNARHTWNRINSNSWLHSYGVIVFTRFEKHNEPAQLRCCCRIVFKILYWEMFAKLNIANICFSTAIRSKKSRKIKNNP